MAAHFDEWWEASTHCLHVNCNKLDITLDLTGTSWRGVVYEVMVEDRQALALVKGDVTGDEPVLCRVHSGSTVADVFSSGAFDGGRNLRSALERIEQQGRGEHVEGGP